MAEVQHCTLLPPLHMCQHDTMSCGQGQKALTAPQCRFSSTHCDGAAEPQSPTSLSTQIQVENTPRTPPQEAGPDRRRGSDDGTGKLQPAEAPRQGPVGPQAATVAISTCAPTSSASLEDGSESVSQPTNDSRESVEAEGNLSAERSQGRGSGSAEDVDELDRLLRAASLKPEPLLMENPARFCFFPIRWEPTDGAKRSAARKMQTHAHSLHKNPVIWISTRLPGNRYVLHTPVRSEALRAFTALRVPWRPPLAPLASHAAWNCPSTCFIPCELPGAHVSQLLL